MKVLVDKAERLWKMPQSALGSMQFIQRRLGARGVKIIDLENLVPEFLAPDSLLTEIQNPMRTPLTQSYNVEQISQLKARIIERHQAFKDLSIDSGKELAITPGVRMASALIALGLLNPGDAAVYPDPGPQFYRTAICLADGNPRRYQLLESNDYMLNISSLPGPGKKTKLLFLNYPHNPTGAAVDYYFYRDLLKTAKFENILIIADCAHVHPGHTEAVVPLQAKNARRKTLELHSFSTTFGVDGLGFAVGHKDVISILNNLLEAIGFKPDAAKVDWTLRCFDHAEEIFNARMNILGKRRAILLEGLKRLDWRVRENKYLPFIWAKIPYRSTSIAYARRLFAKAGVRVAPGSDFGEGGEGWLRMSLCCNEATLNEALERLAQHSRIWQRRFKPET